MDQFVSNVSHYIYCEITVKRTINSRHQQRSSVCPLNKGIMVDFIHWLAWVASYTHALPESGFWTHSVWRFNILQSLERKKTALLFEKCISTLTIKLTSKSVLPPVDKGYDSYIPPTHSPPVDFSCNCCCVGFSKD